MISVRVKTRFDRVKDEGPGWVSADYNSTFDDFEIDAPELEAFLKSRALPATAFDNCRFVSKEVISVKIT